MTTVATFNITLYAKDKKLTDLGACNSSDITELGWELGAFIEDKMKLHDAVKVYVDENEDFTLDVRAEGNFTYDFIGSNVGEKIPFTSGGGCETGITHIMLSPRPRDLPPGVAKLKIRLYAKHKTLTNLGACNSSDINDLGSELGAFIEDKMKVHDAVRVYVDEGEDFKLDVSAEGKFTSDFLASNVGEKIPFTPTGGCKAGITHIMLLNDGQRASGKGKTRRGKKLKRKTLKHHRRHSTRRRATRKA
jgi:hypothetical protein